MTGFFQLVHGDWPWLVDWCMACKGPEYSLEVLLALSESAWMQKNNSYYYGGFEEWYRLREIMVSLPDPDYQRILSRIEARFSSYPLLQQVLISLCFPDERTFADAAARAALALPPLANTRQDYPAWIRLLYLCRLSPEYLLPLARLKTPYIEDKIDPVPTLLHIHGLAAVPAICFYTKDYLFKARERLVETLGNVFCQEVTDWLLQNTIYGRDALSARVAEDPARSLKSLTRLVQAVKKYGISNEQERPLESRPHYALFEGAVRANPALVETMIQDYQSRQELESAELLESMLEKTRPEAPEIPLAELPVELQHAAQHIKLPSWLNLGVLRPPKVQDGRILPRPAVVALMEQLWLGKVPSELDRASLARFSWDALMLWVQSKGPAEDYRILELQSLTLNDTYALKLSGELKRWVVCSHHARAIWGLHVLERLGTDAALVGIYRLSQARKMPQALQEAARESIKRLASSRGFSTEELGDRLVPTLGLEERRVLSYGTREFLISFDELLRPGVLVDGRFVRELPEAQEGEDAALVAQAREELGTLKKEADAAAREQLLRLERALIEERGWDGSSWKAQFLYHPWLVFLARRLVWAVFKKGQFYTSFRVAEDNTLADIEDHSFILEENSEVRLLHPVQVEPSFVETWQKLFTDYQILQPFKQLSRPVYRLSLEATLKQLIHTEIPSGKLVALANRGWHREGAEAGGVFKSWRRKLGNTQLWLYVEPGVPVLGGGGSQRIERLEVRGVLNAVQLSELITLLS